MKYIFTFLTFIFASLLAFSQAPNAMSYQSVIRDANNNLVSNQSIGMQISILQGAANGSSVYTETQSASTNDNGLVSIAIGEGTSNDNFSTIDWANGPYFIKTETDPTGGSNYTITGTNQLLSVPYVLHSNIAETVITERQQLSVSTIGDTLYLQNGGFVIIPGISEANLFIKYPSGSVFCASGPTAIVDVTNPITGKTWMDRNLGAIQVATSSTDINSYGDLYQWGRGTDGHQCRNSATTSTLSSTDEPGHSDFITSNSGRYDWRSSQNDNLWQGLNGTNNPCPIGYRIPTGVELDAERLSWSSNDEVGAFSSPLKLPLAGGRDGSNGSLFNVGDFLGFWSSTVNGDSSSRLRVFNSYSEVNTNFSRNVGASVRCLKD